MTSDEIEERDRVIAATEQRAADRFGDSYANWRCEAEGYETFIEKLTAARDALALQLDIERKKVRALLDALDAERAAWLVNQKTGAYEGMLAWMQASQAVDAARALFEPDTTN